MVAVVSDFRNHLCCSSLYLSYFINVSLSMWGRELHWQTRDLCNGRISSLFLYLKLRTMNQSTLLAVLQLLSVWFCHLRSLVTVPWSYWWSVVVNGWLDMLGTAQEDQLTQPDTDTARKRLTDIAWDRYRLHRITNYTDRDRHCAEQSDRYIIKHALHRTC